MADKKVEENKCRLKGHGTFIVREGWINKALDYVSKDNTIFREKRAADAFGVGNNMGQAIRYWMKACGLMTETSANGAHLTDIGKLIHEKDPYLEDMFSIWLMHCNLVWNNEIATAWYLFFNKCEVDECSKDEILLQMKRELELYIGSNKYSESSLKDDVLAICNMYAKVKEEDYDPEDNRISPFSSLGLMKCVNQKYSKTQPALQNLDDRIVLYCLLKQMKNEDNINIDKLINGENGVCKVLNLSRVAVNQILDRLEDAGFITVNRTAGLDAVYRNMEKTQGLEYLESYYI